MKEQWKRMEEGKQFGTPLLIPLVWHQNDTKLTKTNGNSSYLIINFAGKVIDFSNADVAVDQYHRFHVSVYRKFSQNYEP